VSSPQPSDIHVGAVIADRYELEKIIGEGGMGRVWKARDRSEARHVALKLMEESLEREPELLRRFEREAKVLERIADSSEHVVRVLDHGLTQRGLPFLVMELLEGETLATRLKARQRLPIVEVVPVITQLCDALHAAHRAGIVHRDVKPANVFLHRLGERELVKLLDFGVAKQRVDSDLTSPTRAGKMLGTLDYMSPEQFLGDTNLDARADLFSVGVVVYRMLVGFAPFSRGPQGELGARILGHEPPTPSTQAQGIPSELDAWMQKALAKRAADRFQDAPSLASALSGAISSVTGRHAKGVNLIELAKLLRIARREGSLPELEADDRALLEERVLVSSWYPIETFWRLLELAYQHVLKGSDAQAILLGKSGAEAVMAGVHSAYIKSRFIKTLRSIERGWSAYFDFGSTLATYEDGIVRITIRGYPDIPRVHALTTLGWYSATLALAGAVPRTERLTGEPWLRDEALVFEFDVGSIE
jgi:serine/threonine protein kinase